MVAIQAVMEDMVAMEAMEDMGDIQDMVLVDSQVAMEATEDMEVVMAMEADMVDMEASDTDIIIIILDKELASPNILPNMLKRYSSINIK